MLRRRDFMRRVLAAGTVIYFGCDDADGISMRRPDGSPPDGAEPDLGPADLGPADLGPDPDGALPDMGSGCADPFAGGEFIETVPFTGGDMIRFHERVRAGWDGRLYTDLSLIERDRLITPNDEFYIRTHFPDRLDLDAMMPWQIRVSGLVEDETPIALADLRPLVEPMGTHVLECSGNGRRSHFGLMSAAEWSGIPIEAVLDRLPIAPGGTRIEIGGFDDHSTPSANNHSTPGASWIFTPEQLIERGAFFATEMNGDPLPLDHGFPVRLYVPGWYGCTCIKWVDHIRVVGEDALATSQMIEFAQRTHQDGVPERARDYRPAHMHQAAMPVRIERWRSNGEIVFRVIGILWGGFQPTQGLTIDFGAGPVSVDVCPAMTDNATWTVWTHAWRPDAPGDYQIHCAIEDSAVPTQRLDRGYYDRFVTV